MLSTIENWSDVALKQSNRTCWTVKRCNKLFLKSRIRRHWLKCVWFRCNFISFEKRLFARKIYCCTVGSQCFMDLALLASWLSADIELRRRFNTCRSIKKRTTNPGCFFPLQWAKELSDNEVLAFLILLLSTRSFCWIAQLTGRHKRKLNCVCI